MRKRAIILDLDNTIYPVSDIADKAFKSLFTLIEQSGEYKGDIKEIRSRIMRQPFQIVAFDFSFSERLLSDCLQLLSDLTYEDKMNPFEGYEILRSIPCKKYLVTTGFTKLQQSKIKQLNIDNDFEIIFIIDPSKTKLTKKDIFQQILADHQYKPEEVLVIGDDIHSEIKAANELGIEAIIYNYNGEQTEAKNEKTISTFKEIIPYLK